MSQMPCKDERQRGRAVDQDVAAHLHGTRLTLDDTSIAGLDRARLGSDQVAADRRVLPEVQPGSRLRDQVLADRELRGIEFGVRLPDRVVADRHPIVSTDSGVRLHDQVVGDRRPGEFAEVVRRNRQVIRGAREEFRARDVLRPGPRRVLQTDDQNRRTRGCQYETLFHPFLLPLDCCDPYSSRYRGLRSGYRPPVLEFRILGPLEVVGERGPLRLGGPKQRATLAILLLDANRVVSIDRLADELYPATRGRRASHTDPAAGLELRKLLGSGESLLETRAPGYVIRLAANQLDLNRFEHRAQEAVAAAARGDRDGRCRHISKTRLGSGEGRPRRSRISRSPASLDPARRPPSRGAREAG